MGIYVRTKEISNGRLSLYLDFYPPVKGSNGKFTRREFLDRYLFKRPKNEEEKRFNKENKHFADAVKLKREKEIFNEQDGIFNSLNKKKDFIDFFYNLTEDRRASKGNHDNWLSSLNYLKAFTGNRCKMGDLTEDFCTRFKEYLLTTKQLKTINDLHLSQNSALSYFNKFSAAVKKAFAMRLLSEDPLLNIDGIKQKESIREFLTIEELQILANTDCAIDAWKKVALFAALTGLRWSDIEKLKWKDIQETNGQHFLHIIQKKTTDTMVHPISDKAVSILGTRGESNEKIFKGLKYSDSNNEVIKRWVLKAGINKRITLHNFRHTYATLMLNMGADIFTVSKMLGHKKIETTLRYSKLLTEKKIVASNLINIEI